MPENKNALVVFQDKNIRRTWYNGEWYFSVVDVVGVLSESTPTTSTTEKYHSPLYYVLRIFLS